MSWVIRTLGTFAFLTALLLAVGAVVCYLFRFSMMIGLAVMFVISFVMCFISYFKSKEMALRVNKARIVQEYEEPRLYGIVRGVADKAGLPMPEVGIVTSPVPNAFATGRNPENAAVCATTGLLDTLSDDELEGVIAHEMAHVRNRDILVMSVASMVASMITYLAHIAYFAAIFAPSDDRNGNAGQLLAGVAMSILLPIAAMMVQLAVSRNREYLADRSGAEIINNPRALARALQKIGGVDPEAVYRTEAQRRRGGAPSRPSGSYDSRNDPFAKGGDSIYDCAHMWISSPLRGGGMASLFSTHPPIEERIRRLNEMADRMGL